MSPDHAWFTYALCVIRDVDWSVLLYPKRSGFCRNSHSPALRIFWGSSSFVVHCGPLGGKSPVGVSPCPFCHSHPAFFRPAPITSRMSSSIRIFFRRSSVGYPGARGVYDGDHRRTYPSSFASSFGIRSVRKPIPVVPQKYGAETHCHPKSAVGRRSYGLPAGLLTRSSNMFENEGPADVREPVRVERVDHVRLLHQV